MAPTETLGPVTTRAGATRSMPDLLLKRHGPEELCNTIVRFGSRPRCLQPWSLPTLAQL